MEELINKNTHFFKEEIETLPNIQQSIDDTTKQYQYYLGSIKNEIFEIKADETYSEAIKRGEGIFDRIDETERRRKLIIEKSQETIKTIEIIKNQMKKIIEECNKDEEILSKTRNEIINKIISIEEMIMKNKLFRTPKEKDKITQEFNKKKEEWNTYYSDYFERKKIKEEKKKQEEEKKRKEDEKYNTWNPETGLREKKYFCELEESFFEKEEWYLRLMLIGEDRLAHNLATRDRGRCISFNGISEDFEGMEDELMDVEERVNRQQIAEEMMSVLSDKQKKVVQEFYWNQKTHKQIAKENGVKRNAVTEILKYALNKMRRGSCMCKAVSL